MKWKTFNYMYSLKQIEFRQKFWCWGSTILLCKFSLVHGIVFEILMNWVFIFFTICKWTPYFFSLQQSNEWTENLHMEYAHTYICRSDFLYRLMMLYLLKFNKKRSVFFQLYFYVPLLWEDSPFHASITKFYTITCVKTVH